jgi:hypothetical protein
MNETKMNMKISLSENEIYEHPGAEYKKRLLKAFF